MESTNGQPSSQTYFGIRFFFRRLHVSCPRDHDNIRNTCEQVLAATVVQEKTLSVATDWILKGGRKPYHWRIYPLIIFDGPLWEITVDRNDDMNLIPVEGLSYLYAADGKNRLIDIIKADSLGAYLDVLDKELANIGSIGSEVKS